MAMCTVKVNGGAVRTINANTIGDAKAQMGLSGWAAVVNNNPAFDTDKVQEGSTIYLATQSKGG